MTLALEQRPQISQGDVEVVSIDYTDWLDADELLTGVPQVQEIGSSDLSLTHPSVSTSELKILARKVAAGKAAQFVLAGQQAGRIYAVDVTVTTNAAPQRTAVRRIVFETH